MGRIGEIIQSAKNVRQLFPTVAEVTQERANWRKGIKKYDSAKTPFQRILLSEHISDKKKKRLTIQYGSLDPIALMSQLQRRIAACRRDQESQEEKLRELMVAGSEC